MENLGGGIILSPTSRHTTLVPIERLMKPSRPQIWTSTGCGGFFFPLNNLLYFIKSEQGSSQCGTMEMSLTSNHGVMGLIPGLAQWAEDLVLL